MGTVSNDSHSSRDGALPPHARNTNAPPCTVSPQPGHGGQQGRTPSDEARVGGKSDRLPNEPLKWTFSELRSRVNLQSTGRSARTPHYPATITYPATTRPFNPNYHPRHLRQNRSKEIQHHSVRLTSRRRHLNKHTSRSPNKF